MAYGYGRGEMARAIEVGNAALAGARDLGLQQQTAYILTDIANMHSISGNIAGAVTMLSQAEPLWRALHNLPMLAFDLNTLAQMSVAQGRFADALAYGREGERICRDIDNMEGLCLALGMLGD